MILFRFISFCWFFNKYFFDWPTVQQGKMFFLAERGGKHVAHQYGRQEGATTFLAFYAAWFASRNKDKKVAFVTTAYGSRKLRVSGLLDKLKNLNVIPAHESYLRGVNLDAVFVDNEKIDEGVLIPLLTFSKKSVFFFTL